jgi:hypothetical protein
MITKRNRKVVKREQSNTKLNMANSASLETAPHDNSLSDLRDLRNALAFLEHLDRCHWSAFTLPGVMAALQRTEELGPHCHDRAWRFVHDTLYQARQRCE